MMQTELCKPSDIEGFPLQRDEKRAFGSITWSEIVMRKVGGDKHSERTKDREQKEKDQRGATLRNWRSTIRAGEWEEEEEEEALLVLAEEAMAHLRQEEEEEEEERGSDDNEK